MASQRSIITEKVQDLIRRKNWKAAIREMEKLFALDQDPLIRVRIGDIRRKLDRKREAMWEYVLAADLFAETGFVSKALAQYQLALRLDPTNTPVRTRMERLRTSARKAKPQRASGEYLAPHPERHALHSFSPER